jgi:hypothetical protein
LVTLATFQDEMSPLKAEAQINKPSMLLTSATSQDERSPLKAVASSNITFMLVEPVRSGVSMAVI